MDGNAVNPVCVIYVTSFLKPCVTLLTAVSVRIDSLSITAHFDLKLAQFLRKDDKDPMQLLPFKAQPCKTIQSNPNLQPIAITSRDVIKLEALS